MKALILNSGTGSRMGEITQKQPKCMTKLASGETILQRQLRQLVELGITDVVITTGLFDDEIKKHCMELDIASSMQFDFVKNEKYNTTNYIYSIYLAKDHLDSDILMLHGDIVVDTYVLYKIVHTKNAMPISTQMPLPDKDFKAVIENSKITKVGIEFFDNAVATQPIYSLNYDVWQVWLKKIIDFCQAGNCSVYAENAFNDIDISLSPIEYGMLLCNEIDTLEDLALVNSKLEGQNIVYVNDTNDTAKYVSNKDIFVVCGSSYDKLAIASIISNNASKVTRFSQFTPNPTYEEVVKGVESFVNSGSSVIVAVGGGSAIDVAKCIKLFANMQVKDYLNNNMYTDSSTELIAIPTTAGTGSESTQFAVIYKDGAKLSIDTKFILPKYAILDSSLLLTLPDKQKKATILDALCQAIESFWSVNSTLESKAYANEAIKIIIANYKGYIQNGFFAKEILIASNFAGRAINITRTTAPHAMSYKLTSMFDIPHGEAVALCLPHVYNIMQNNMHKCIDIRGEAYVADVLNQLKETIGELVTIIDTWGIGADVNISDNDIIELSNSVNTERLKNSPIQMDNELIKRTYKNIWEA